MRGPSSARIATLQLALSGACGGGLQTLLVRELLATFGGHEALVAAVLGPWLLLTGAGAALARGAAPAPSLRSLALVLQGGFGYFALVAARVLPRAFDAGAAPGLASAVAVATLLLAPSCLLAGATFTWLAREDGASGGRGYFAESLGAAAAGALLSFGLLGRVGSFAIAAGLVAVVSLAGALDRRQGRAGLAAAASGLAFAAVAALLPVGPWALAWQAPHLAGAVERDAPTGAVFVTRGGGEPVLFLGRDPLVPSLDVAIAEEAAHLPLALHPSPRQVALLGVAPRGAIARMWDHGVDRVVVVLEDPVVAEVLRRELPELRAPGVELVVDDTRRALGARRGQFDAVLLYATDPVSAQQNRSFTLEFFQTLRGALRAGGLASIAMGGHAAAAGLERRRLHSSVARTLEAVFGPLGVLPAGFTFYVGFEAPARTTPPPAARLAASFEETLRSRGISPAWLRGPVLADALSAQRLEESRRWASLPEPVNTDLRPTTYRLALDRVLAEVDDLGIPGLLLLAAALAALALLAFGPRARPVELAVFCSGASGLAGQLTLLLAFQVATGALYRDVGALLAGYMLGAAVGARAGALGTARRLVLLSDLGQAAVAAAMAGALPSLVRMGPEGRPVFLAAVFIVGLLPGAQFAASAREGSRHTGAGTLYAADLLGAAVAALATFTFLIPAIGVVGSWLVIAGLKAATSLALALPRRAEAPVSRGAFARIVPVAFASIVVAAVADRTAGAFSALTFGRPYRTLVLLALLGALLLAAAGPARAAWRARRARREEAETTPTLEPPPARPRGLSSGDLPRLLWTLLLLPVAASPIARCYFQIPYLFCHACPRPCVFGMLRGSLVPAVLLANLDRRSFCSRMCPLGAVQSACGRLALRPPRGIGRLTTLRWPALALALAAWLLARREEGLSGNAWFAAFFRNAFTPSLWVLGGASALLAMSFFFRRPLCRTLCPLGTASEIALRAERAAAQAVAPESSASGGTVPPAATEGTP